MPPQAASYVSIASGSTLPPATPSTSDHGPQGLSDHPSDESDLHDSSSSDEDIDEPVRCDSYRFRPHWNRAMKGMRIFYPESVSPPSFEVPEATRPYKLQDSTAKFLRQCLDKLTANSDPGHSLAPSSLRHIFPNHRVAMHHPDLPFLHQFFSGQQLRGRLVEHVPYASNKDSVAISSSERSQDAYDRRLAASSALLLDTVNVLGSVIASLEDHIGHKRSRYYEQVFRLALALGKQVTQSALAQAAQSRCNIRRSMIPHVGSGAAVTLLKSSIISEKLFPQEALEVAQNQLGGRLLSTKPPSSSHKRSHSPSRRSHGPSKKVRPWQNAPTISSASSSNAFRPSSRPFSVGRRSQGGGRRSQARQPPQNQPPRSAAGSQGSFFPSRPGGQRHS